MTLTWKDWALVVIPALVGVALFISLIMGCASPPPLQDRCEATYSQQEDLLNTGTNPFLQPQGYVKKN